MGFSKPRRVNTGFRKDDSLLIGRLRSSGRAGYRCPVLPGRSSPARVGMEGNELDLDVDVDEYATAAASDTKARSDRTTLTDADFQATRASYRAKIDNGQVRIELMTRLASVSLSCWSRSMFYFSLSMY